jgi:hypothetical protein
MLGALLSVAIGAIAAGLLVIATGRADNPAFLVATGCLVAGFLGLAVAGGPETPLRPMRLALGLSMPVSGYMLAGLPWPPGAAERGSFLALSATLILSALAIVFAGRHPRLAAMIVAGLAVYGTFVLVRFARSLPTLAVEWAQIGPAITIAYLLAASVAAAWLAALWHSRELWATFDRHPDSAT